MSSRPADSRRSTDLATVRGRVVDAGFAAGWRAVRAIPEPIAARGFRLAADVAVARDRAGVRQLRANLRRVLGPAASSTELDAAVKAGMRSYTRYWLETFRLPTMDHAAVVADLEANCIGAHYIDEALAAGRGYVLALPHMGNWDVSGLWLIERYHRPFTTVAERLKPESLFDRFVAYREGLGMEVLALTGGPTAAVSVLGDRLRAGGGVCLVADRDLSKQGIEVDFFGERARMPGGPAMLAATTGAALIPVGPWFTEHGWAQRIGPPIELTGKRLGDRVRGATQALADVFAAMITERPTDWHMLQPFWLTDRDNQKDDA